jgi:hypothetical protein
MQEKEKIDDLMCEIQKLEDHDNRDIDMETGEREAGKALIDERKEMEEL